jgi:hypothetical protein
MVDLDPHIPCTARHPPEPTNSPPAAEYRLTSNMTRPFETMFILFVDMLGFAALVAKEADAIQVARPLMFETGRQ